MVKRTVVCDIEADGLFSNATKIWCIAAKDYDTGETFFWGPDELHEFHIFADNVHHWIGHNFISYDLRMLKKFLNIRIRPTRVTDTLLVSRLQCFSREGGHSLANWGKILNHPKPEHDDWTQYSPEMKVRCQQDVELNYKVADYLKLEGKAFGSEKASKIEHVVQHLLEDQSEYGFALDVQKAHQLFAMFGNKANQLEKEIIAEFPPKAVSVREAEPRYTADGSLSKVGLKSFGKEYTQVAGPFTLIDWQPFNLGSPKQKVARLAPWWSPVIRTKGYRKLKDKVKEKKLTQVEADLRAETMWQICEENLATLSPDAPQSLKKLTEHAMYVARYKEVEGWIDALGPDNRVHGTVFSTGAITHRMSHNSPNLANIPGVESPYGEECRSCFIVDNPYTHCLLGCDASGIQLRVLAHYMNDPDYTKEVLTGDIHTTNLLAMGIDKGIWDEHKQQWSARAIAKTFIYAWLLGAGDEKVGLICGGDSTWGRQVKDKFLSALPSLAALKQRAAEAARLGRLVGLDGRKIELKSAHFALSAYLQGAESCVMKYAMILWHRRVQDLGLDAKQVAVVHDEFQVEVRREHAEQVGEIIVQSIRDAGEYFKLNCPMDGEYKIGNNWLDTH